KRTVAQVAATSSNRPVGYWLTGWGAIMDSSRLQRLPILSWSPCDPTKFHKAERGRTPAHLVQHSEVRKAGRLAPKRHSTVGPSRGCRFGLGRRGGSAVSGGAYCRVMATLQNRLSRVRWSS